MLRFLCLGKPEGRPLAEAWPRQRSSEVKAPLLSFSAQCRAELTQSSAKSRAIGPRRTYALSKTHVLQSQEHESQNASLPSRRNLTKLQSWTLSESCCGEAFNSLLAANCMLANFAFVPYLVFTFAVAKFSMGKSLNVLANVLSRISEGCFLNTFLNMLSSAKLEIYTSSPLASNLFRLLLQVSTAEDCPQPGKLADCKEESTAGCRSWTLKAFEGGP